MDGGNSREEYDKEEGEWESRFERHMNEEKERKRQMKHSRSAEGQQHPPSSPLQHGAEDVGEVSPNKYGNDEHSRKRSRKEVDYKHLFKQMQKEGY